MSHRESAALPDEAPRDYLHGMKINRQSPGDRGRVTRDETTNVGEEGLTPESIQRVRDFTARKTLEQALAFVTGLRRLHADPDPDEADRALLAELESVGIGAHDAEHLGRMAIDLIELMADRDRKAEVFHAAVKEAGQSERAMYERLASIARVLRARLGSRSPDLGKLGVPPDPAPDNKPRPRGGKGIFSAVVVK